MKNPPWQIKIWLLKYFNYAFYQKLWRSIYGDPSNSSEPTAWQRDSWKRLIIVKWVSQKKNVLHVELEMIFKKRFLISLPVAVILLQSKRNCKGTEAGDITEHNATEEFKTAAKWTQFAQMDQIKKLY